MRPKRQKRSALKLADRIIPQSGGQHARDYIQFCNIMFVSANNGGKFKDRQIHRDNHTANNSPQKNHHYRLQ